MHIKSENTAAQYRATVPVNADMLLLYYDMSLILFLSGKICLNETLSRRWFGCHKASSGAWNRICIPGQNKEKQNYDKNPIHLPRHSSFMIMHTFADWATQGRIRRKALELLRFRLLRLMGGIGIKANVVGEILSSNGLLRLNVLHFYR